MISTSRGVSFEDPTVLFAHFENRKAHCRGFGCMYALFTDGCVLFVRCVCESQQNGGTEHGSSCSA